MVERKIKKNKEHEVIYDPCACNVLAKQDPSSS